jgi:hypothetical protein
MDNTPKPSRRQKRLAETKRKFLAGIEQGYNVVEAAAMAGWDDRTSPYKAAQADPDFARDWDAARRLRLSILKDTTWDRVMSGDTDGPTVSLIKFLWAKFESEEQRAAARADRAEVGRIEIVMPGESYDPSAAPPFFEFPDDNDQAQDHQD